MTFSIVARCAQTNQLGIGAVTGTPGVGKLLTWARRGVGAIATQGFVNPYLGIDGLDLLANGHGAERVRDAVLGLDDDREMRQLTVLDRNGEIAAWTGSRCAEVAHVVQGDGFGVAGNKLRNAETVEACAEAYLADPERDLVDRLMDALGAGEDAGGDERGSISATVLVVETEEYPLWDVRVDDHPEPLTELRRLQERFATELLPQIRKLPKRNRMAGDLDPDRNEGMA